MPTEFTQQPSGGSGQITRLAMAYDGSGRRISKTFLTKSATAASWDTVKVTHYTGIGTEIREEFHNGSRERVSVVVNMPQGLGRYNVADASQPADDNASRTFEWYLKNHLGSTMLVYGTVASTNPNNADIGETKAAYDYRAFGEMVTLSQPSDKVTENFTGKERDDETKLNYFGARYLDPMLGLWTSVDPARQFSSPYLYVGNGVNSLIGVDFDGNKIWLTYYQKTGRLYGFDDNLNKTVIDHKGYSGYMEGKNNPSMQNERNVGPIPRGKWNVGNAYNSNATGPATIILTPQEEGGPDLKALNRNNDFRIHGDKKNDPGNASHGCIIMPRSVRDVIINNKDGAELEVLEDEPKIEMDIEVSE